MERKVEHFLVKCLAEKAFILPGTELHKWTDDEFKFATMEYLKAICPETKKVCSEIAKKLKRLPSRTKIFDAKMENNVTLRKLILEFKHK
jgi:hypothetical protein